MQVGIVSASCVLTKCSVSRLPPNVEQTDSPDSPANSECARGDVKFCGGFSGKCPASEKCMRMNV